jgi:hypothetical protein
MCELEGGGGEVERQGEREWMGKGREGGGVYGIGLGLDLKGEES